MDHQTARRPESHLLKAMDYVLFITLCLTSYYEELIPFKQDEHIWVHLAKHSLNTSDLCHSG